MLNVKNADMADFEQIMKIYKYAQDYMIKSEILHNGGIFIRMRS